MSEDRIVGSNHHRSRGRTQQKWRARSALSAVGVLALSAGVFSACSSSATPSQASSSSSTASSSSSSSSTGSKTIAYIGGVTPNPGYDTIYCGVKVAATKQGDTVYNAGPSSFTAAAQVQAFNAVLLKKPSAIVLGPVTASSVVAEVAQAASSGIPVVDVVSPVDNSKAIAFVNPDTNQGGLAAVQYLAKQLPKGGQVAIVGLSPTNGVDQARVSAYKSALKTEPQFQLVATQYGGDSVTSSAQLVSTLLLAHPNLAAILVSSATPTQGVAEGIKSSGKVGKLQVIGYGISAPPDYAALKAGTIQAVVSQDLRVVGADAFKALQAHFSGQLVTRSVMSKELLVTPSNINSSTVQLAAHGDSC